MDSVEASASNQYIVEAIRGKKEIHGKAWYFIKWMGYSEDENTWEPLPNCTGALSMIREFEANLKQQKRCKSVGARTPKHLTSQEGQTHRKTDICVPTNRFECLNLNLENQPSNSEPKRNKFDHQVNKEFRQNNSTSVDHEKNRRKNSKSTRGRKPKSKTSHARRCLSKANFNQSNIDDLENIRPERDARFDNSIPNVNTISTCQIDCMAASTETETNSPSNERFTIEKLRQCSASEIEIVGAEPVGNGVTIGIRALNDDNVFRLDSKEVTELWAQLYVSFLESHIRFDDDDF